MTVNTRVNPKKLRPYDVPPKRRRTLIPSAPDSSAIGFIVVAALWLALSGALGLLALGLRFIPFEFSFGLGIFNLAFQIDLRRVDSAFVNAAVYGWLSNAGFAAICFMAPRLTGRRLALEPFVFLGLLAWNSALLGGIASLYFLDLGPHAPLTAMNWIFDGGLAAGASIVALSLVLTSLSSLTSSYVSLWFAGIAILSLLGLLTANAVIGVVDWLIGLDDVVEGLASVFVQRATTTLWLLGMAYAVLHYVVPRAVLQPLASRGVAILTFLTWLVLAPASALAVLVDDSVPYIITSWARLRRSPSSCPPCWRLGTWRSRSRGAGPCCSALAPVRLPPSHWCSCSRRACSRRSARSTTSASTSARPTGAPGYSSGPHSARSRSPRSRWPIMPCRGCSSARGSRGWRRQRSCG